MILPATRRAVAASRTGRIGVICTRATAESLAYDDAFAAAPQVDLVHPGLPALRGLRRARRHRRRRAARRPPTSTSTRWSPRSVDTLILGCTHYPLLTGVISYVMGDDVTLVSSAEECAKDVYKLLVSHRPDARRAGTRRTTS